MLQVEQAGGEHAEWHDEDERNKAWGIMKYDESLSIYAILRIETTPQWLQRDLKNMQAF